jgi:hypothetical protein
MATLAVEQKFNGARAWRYLSPLAETASVSLIEFELSSVTVSCAMPVELI